MSIFSEFLWSRYPDTPHQFGYVSSILVTTFAGSYMYNIAYFRVHNYIYLYTRECSLRLPGSMNSRTPQIQEAPFAQQAGWNIRVTKSQGARGSRMRKREGGEDGYTAGACLSKNQSAAPLPPLSSPISLFVYPECATHVFTDTWTVLSLNGCPYADMMTPKTNKGRKER